MAPKNSTRVRLAGSTDKRIITLTLTVTLDGKILPFQIIYGGKTDQSLPKITFPAKFSTSVNEKHYSNTDEVIKHLQEIVIPYVTIDMGRFSWPESRSGNFFTTRAKNIE